MSNAIFENPQILEKLSSLPSHETEPQYCEILNALYDSDENKALSHFKTLFYKFEKQGASLIHIERPKNGFYFGLYLFVLYDRSRNQVAELSDTLTNQAIEYLSERSILPEVQAKLDKLLEITNQALVH